MWSRLESARREFRSTLSPQQQRGVKVLGWIAGAVLIGLTLTGIWQFFTHESDPAWFDHVVGSGTRQPTSPSEGGAALHGTLSTFAGAVALIGGAWFCYKVAFSVPKTAVAALVLAIVGSVTGSLIRFNAIALSGQSYQDAGSGYPQIFVDDVDVVVTDAWDLGPMAARLLTLSHVLVIPVLLTIAWFGITRAGQSKPTPK